MTKVSVKPEDLKKFYTYASPKSAILVTAVDETGKPNIITLAWHSPVSIDPPLYGISIHPKRYTHELIEKTKEFVVNFPSWKLLEKVHHCGSVSGRKVDKFRQTGLTPWPSEKVRPPSRAECYLHLECKLGRSPALGDHTWFCGNIVAITADEGAFEDGILGEQGDPILYMGKDKYQNLRAQRVQMRKRN
jgi:flavin reductase (DIM6/NTAB) family NADH-FMN oxidoreductase RutF